MKRAREIDITNAEDVARIINEIEGQQNIDRKKDAWIGHQALEGNQRWYVKEELKRIYPETWQQFRIGDISLARKIIGKIAKAYKSEPDRTLDTEAETDAFESIVGKSDLQRELQEFDKIFNYYKYCFLWIGHINPEESTTGEFEYTFQALRPFDYDLIRDEITGEPLIFILNPADSQITGDTGRNNQREELITEDSSDTNAETKKYSLWSKDKHVQVLLKKSGDDKKPTISFLEIPGNPSMDNPVKGHLPGVFLTKSTSVDYPIANNLWHQSISWNVDLSDYKTARATQGHGQLVIKHPEGQELKRVHMGQHTAIKLPQSKKEGDSPTEAQYISANPDLAGMLEGLKFEAVNILDEHGIKSKGGIEGGTESFASGLDRLLSMADVVELIIFNQNIYANKLEQTIYKYVQATETALNKSTFRSDDMQVRFDKPRPITNTIEQLEEIQKKRELGLIEEHEKLMMIDTNLTQEEAIEKLERINAEKQSMVNNARQNNEEN